MAELNLWQAEDPTHQDLMPMICLHRKKYLDFYCGKPEWTNHIPRIVYKKLTAELEILILWKIRCEGIPRIKLVGVE